jgi:hypothetical protein
MLMLITLLTDGALISVGYDIVKPNPIPEQWNLVRLFIIASVMGGVSLGACILYIYIYIYAHATQNPNRVTPPPVFLPRSRFSNAFYTKHPPSRLTHLTSPKYRLVAAALGCGARLEQSEWHVRGAWASPH